jgi:hypothetical protein
MTPLEIIIHKVLYRKLDEECSWFPSREFTFSLPRLFFFVTIQDLEPGPSRGSDKAGTSLSLKIIPSIMGSTEPSFAAYVRISNPDGEIHKVPRVAPPRGLHDSAAKPVPCRVH